MSHGPILEAAVEYFFNFLRFCSTFRSARVVFEVSGRQKRDIPPFFVYFRFRATRLAYGQIPVLNSGIVVITTIQPDQDIDCGNLHCICLPARLNPDPASPEVCDRTAAGIL